MVNEGNIEVLGARVHNLKNISVSIPRKRLTVITGLSGSGKSSLAFDTIFAEGQRRYMDTFSSYARGFIGQMQRPDVDKITGLSPVISIDQKTTSKNPRSTVGTITETYDFLRLLFARAGQAYSYLSGKPMVHYTDDQIINLILKEYEGKKIMLLAPMVSGRKGHYKELFETVRKKGFVHVRVDGEVREIVAGMKLDRYKTHTIEVVVDKLKPKAEEDMPRLRQSIDKAMTQGNGIMLIIEEDGKTRYMSRNLMCPDTGLSYQDPAPHTFSFNSPSGWCPCCKGLGRVKSEELIVNNKEVDEALQQDDWWEEIKEMVQDKAPEEEEDEEQDEWIECPECHGKRLNKEALSYRFGPYNINELAEMDIEELLRVMENLAKENTDRFADRIQTASLTDKQKVIAEPILKEICARLRFMQSVGLSYLSLNRSSESLSGGESQRIRLATQIGSRLVNVLYILDEPSIGLHQRDNQRLINSLKELRDMNNSVIVVEHDEQMMREADWIIDIGPKAGRLGGKVMFSGTPKDLLKTDTLTAQYLKGERVVTQKESDIIGNNPNLSDNSTKFLTLSGCTGNNLKDVTVKIPLGKMVCVTGVSGSGKSSLINQTLYPILRQHFYHSKQVPLPYKSIEGMEHINKIINVDQSPIGRMPRSNPATYTNVFNDIRDLFAQIPESKIRGWKAGRFSFNMKGGRCDECMGNGYKQIQMHFMPDVFVPCEACGCTRYNRETLEVRWKGKNIAEILDMTVNQAVEFFEAQPKILRKIKTIQEVGLGYIKLGQSSTSLSGGESQRVKLAAELSRPSTSKTLFILDEPTTGLHFEDIRVLMGVLRQLVDKGNTVLIIEHNTDVIRACDWIIDMGPEGGRGGGEVVAEGTIEDIRKNPKSITGQYI
ncbi:MAG: excinuclease ABC subunit UvrA [Paludibacteraceae bacterium]|nr:excinuclease ABC subunit UvrA [Paludibacteraceae bacterium]MBR6493171.1 excinuclease ABC subunit UvrA [Paludibacteraceae bacterium]